MITAPEDKLRNRVETILSNESCHTQLYLVLKNLELRQIDIKDEDESEIRDLFKEFLRTKIVDNDDMTIRDLSVTDEFPNTIYKYDYASYPEKLTPFKHFEIGTAVELEKFNFKADNLEGLFGYIIYLGTMEDGVVLFKRHYPVSLIKRGSFLWWARDERFERLPDKDIIRMSGDIQLLRVDDDIFVLDLKVLERDMGFSELIQKAAADTVDAIEALDILDDIELLRKALKDAPGSSLFARKLSKIKKASPIFKLKIPKDVIVKFTKDTKELKDKFNYSEDGTQIRLDTKKSRDAFLKLMSDDFLKSELTKQYYEASAKDTIT